MADGDEEWLQAILDEQARLQQATPQQAGLDPSVGAGGGAFGDLSGVLGSLPSFGQEVTPDRPEYIGGFLARPQAQNVLRSTGRQPDAGYREGQQYTILQSLAPERLARLQELLVASGLESSVLPGQLDNATVRGFTEVLAMANRSGTAWEDVLQQVQRQVEVGAEVARAQDRYLPPDYASLKQAVRSRFTADLGRQPTQSELALFVDELRADFDAAGAIEVANVGAGRGELAEPETQVDPMSRFEEAFLARYQGQVESLGDQPEAATAAGLARANVAASGEI